MKVLLMTTLCLLQFAQAKHLLIRTVDQKKPSGGVTADKSSNNNEEAGDDYADEVEVEDKDSEESNETKGPINTNKDDTSNSESKTKKKSGTQGTDFMGSEAFHDIVDMDMIDKFMEMHLEDQAQLEDGKRSM